MEKNNEGQEDIPISGWDTLTLPTRHVVIEVSTRRVCGLDRWDRRRREV
ncbi:MAG: hypothetical protein J5661_01345 [Bacteroidaceae bacterium]|nr:hypothetical protein [Bacteroidaceae bacterium]